MPRMEGLDALVSLTLTASAIETFAEAATYSAETLRLAEALLLAARQVRAAHDALHPLIAPPVQAGPLRLVVHNILETPENAHV